MCGEQQTRPDGRHRVISLEKSSQQRQMPVAALSCYFCSLGQNNSWARPESWRAQCRWIMCSKSHIKQQSRCIGPICSSLFKLLVTSYDSFIVKGTLVSDKNCELKHLINQVICWPNRLFILKLKVETFDGSSFRNVRICCFSLFYITVN